MVGYVLIALLIGLPLLWDFTTRKYLNPYKLYLVFGKKGSGKSTYLVKLARKHLKKGWIVYTNMEELFMPGVRHFEIKHLGDFVPEAHSLLLLDEVGMIWDNRDFKNFSTQVRDYFKLQRHYQHVVILASQTFDVDKKIRDLADEMYLVTKKLRVFSYAKKILRQTVLVEATGQSPSKIDENLVFDSLLLFWAGARKFTFIPRYTKYFDSFKVPELKQRDFEKVPELKIPVKRARLFPRLKLRGRR